MLNDRKIKLGLSMRYLGYHVAAWRHPDVPADGAVHFDYFLKSAIKAEAAKISAICPLTMWTAPCQRSGSVAIRCAALPKTCCIWRVKTS